MKLFVALLLCPLLSYAQPKKLSIFSSQTGSPSGSFVSMGEEKQASGTILLSDSLVQIGKGVFKVDSVSRINLPPLLSYLYYTSLHGKPCTLTVTSSDNGVSWSAFFDAGSYAVQYRAKED